MTQSLSQQERSKILASIERLVLKHHINVGQIDYDAWMRLLRERTPKLVAGDAKDFEKGVRSLLAELKTSHVAFYRERPDGLPPQHSISATMRNVSDARQPKWMFLDVFEAGPARIAGIGPGELLLAIDGIDYATAEPPIFAVGRSYRLKVAQLNGENVREISVVVPFKKGTQDRPPIVEPKSPIHRMISSSVGLLKVPYFAGPMGLRFARELDAAIIDLKKQGCDGLIIDLRGNIGGGLGLARLASYLCPNQLPIGQSLTPRRLRSGYEQATLPRVPMPQTRLSLITTFGRFAFRDKSIVLMTQGLGPQPFHGSVVMLINDWTNSGGEMVASFASEQNLATLIGVKTAGNVLGATNLKLPCSYRLRLPVFGWYRADGTALEQVGVSPHVQLDIDPELLSQGIDNQMDAAVETLGGATISAG